MHETAVWEDPAIRNGSEETALTEIVGDGLRIECVDVGVIGVFGIESEDGGEAVGRVDVPIELRLGVDALVDANVVGIGERRDAESVVAQVKRLEDVEFAFNERAGKGEMRREALYSVSAAIDPTETRNGIFEEPLPFIAAAARGDFNDTAGKITELGRKRIGEHAHGIDGGVG